MSLSKCEQEVVINFNAEDNTATLYSSSPVWIRKMDKPVEQNPEQFKMYRQETVKGKVVSKFYELPKEFVTIRSNAKAMFQLICKDGHARRGAFTTPHGSVQTPGVHECRHAGGHQGRALGGGSGDDRLPGRAVQHVPPARASRRRIDPRPGRPAQIHDLGKTDSDRQRRISDLFAGAASEDHAKKALPSTRHVDGRHIFMGPEESMRIQANLGSDIAMAFDECIKIPSPYDYVKNSCDRTYRWLQRCKAALTDYTRP